MLSEDTRRVITRQGLGVVVTVRADGTPNLSPKGTTEEEVAAPWRDRLTRTDDAHG